MKIKWMLAPLMAALFSCSTEKKQEEENVTETTNNKTPNIVIFYVDDLGYGDLSCYGATTFKTPNVDKLAENGRLFTDAHCSAATCTPSRYSLLTGNYAFRMNAGILPGDAPLLIQPGTPTLPAKLKEAGYKTGVVGKWHLGLGNGNVDWNKEVKLGPLEIGFDYSFLLPATGDRVPSVYLENHNVVGLNPEDTLLIAFTDDASDPNPFNTPTGLTNPELLRQQADTQHSGTIVNGVSRIGFMDGASSTYWKDEDFPEVLTGKANDFITENKDEPFFLYFAFHDIHVPRVPNEQFVGATPHGPRGDAIIQMDWMTGKVMEKLEELGLAENTLVVFSSDNGPVLNDGYEDDAVEKLGEHKPWGPFKGGKYSIYEAGNRMPTIVHWPNGVKPGKSNALWNQVDLYASIGALVGYEVPTDKVKDSENMLDVIQGNSDKGRDEMFMEAFTHAYRKGNWKYITPKEKTPDWIMDQKEIEGGVMNVPQLYNLAEDPHEDNNLAAEYPEKVKDLQALLTAILEK